MNLRKHLRISLEEEEAIVNELVDTFRDMCEQNAKIKIERAIEKLLEMDISNTDDINLTYNQSFNIGTVQAFLNRLRRDNKKKGKQK